MRTFDIEQGRAIVDGQSYTLSYATWRVYEALYQSQDRFITSRHILDIIGRNVTRLDTPVSMSHPDTPRWHVSQLIQTFGRDAILTRRGHGWRLNSERVGAKT